MSSQAQTTDLVAKSCSRSNPKTLSVEEATGKGFSLRSNEEDVSMFTPPVFWVHEKSHRTVMYLYARRDREECGGLFFLAVAWARGAESAL